VNFGEFQTWRVHCLKANPDLLDCAETNLYRSLEHFQPKPDFLDTNLTVHRCDLARQWMARYGFSPGDSQHALVCRGVRHALALIFKELSKNRVTIWIPGDVYPVYLEIAKDAGIKPLIFTTLPEPKIPTRLPDEGAEYLLIANPWKPLGRYLTDWERDTLVAWLGRSPQRHLLIDCVYDFGVPFHATTQRLMETGRAILLHSVTKGWLWPKTFGVALFSKGHLKFESVFRADPPTQDQLRLARHCLSAEAKCPNRVVAALQDRASRLFEALPGALSKSLALDPAQVAPGCYFFPIDIHAEVLLKKYGLLAIPGSAFGSDWAGSILSSLANVFGQIHDGARP
jgi:aspartate/methionine/tyrosine aminotransferase